jgi:hypothetical protein
LNKKNLVIIASIYGGLILIGIILGVCISENAIVFFPLSLILASIFASIYTSIVKKKDSLVNILVSGLGMIGSYFERAFEFLVDVIKGTFSKLDFLWIFGIILSLWLSVVYGVIFIYVSILVCVFVFVGTLITTLSHCIVMPFIYITNTEQKSHFVTGMLSAVIFFALMAWHILNMIFLL